MLEVEFSTAAEKGLGSIEKHIAQRIFKKIRWLAENSEYINHEPLSAQLKGTYKLRVGDYRVVYTLEKEDTDFIIIHLVGVPCKNPIRSLKPGLRDGGSSHE